MLATGNIFIDALIKTRLKINTDSFLDDGDNFLSIIRHALQFRCCLIDATVLDNIN